MQRRTVHLLVTSQPLPHATAADSAPCWSAPSATRLWTRDTSVGVAAGSAAAASLAASRAARSLSAAVSARKGWSSSCGQSRRRDGCFSRRPCDAGGGSKRPNLLHNMPGGCRKRHHEALRQRGAVLGSNSKRAASAHCASTYLEEGGKQRGHGLRVLDLLPHLWHARVRSRRWSGISSM